MNKELLLEMNEPLTDVEKNKLVGEAKEFISTVFQACENCDAGKLTATFMNSPDFVSLINGVIDDYEQTVKKYPVIMSDFKTQKATILNEKYVVLDASTILYTSTSKWECELKNNTFQVYEPVGVLLILKKADDNWHILGWTEAYSGTTAN